MDRKLLVAILLANLGMSAQNFSLVENHGIIPVQYSSVAFADIDGDGDIDLFTLGGSPNLTSARMYKNDGNGVFALHDSETFIKKRDGGAAFGDVDGDGAVDLLISGSSPTGPETKLYLNDGNGNFSLSPNSDFIGTTQGDVAIADTDGDGDNDIIVSGMHSSNNYVFASYENNGAGVFTRNLASGLEEYGMFTTSLAIDDLNGDGLVDIVASSKVGLQSSGLGVRIFMNQGDGSFTLAKVKDEVELFDTTSKAGAFEATRSDGK